MNEQNQQTLDTIQDIKRIMERSSRFISLSGLSGIAAGICALVGAWFAKQKLDDYYVIFNNGGYTDSAFHQLKIDLFIISMLVLATA